MSSDSDDYYDDDYGSDGYEYEAEYDDQTDDEDQEEVEGNLEGGIEEQGILDEEEVMEKQDTTDGGEVNDSSDTGSERDTEEEEVEVTVDGHPDSGSESSTDEEEVDDSSDEGSERDTDDEEIETEDDESFASGFSGVEPGYLYGGAPYLVGVSPPQRKSSPSTQPCSAAGAEQMIEEARVLMMSILGNKSMYKTLLRTEGDKAQILLNVMQKASEGSSIIISNLLIRLGISCQLLDDQSAPSDLRSKILHAVIRFCTASTLYPRWLVLHDVQHEEESETSGAFGDIWVGSYQGRQVCLKVARIYRRKNVDDLLKVCIQVTLLSGVFASLRLPELSERSHYMEPVQSSESPPILWDISYAGPLL